MKRKLTAVLLVVALVLAFGAIPAYAAPPTMPPPGDHYTFNTVTKLSTLFNDTFDGGLTQWTHISGTWAIFNDGGNNVCSIVGGSYVGGVVATAGSLSWTDYSLEFDVKKVSGAYFNVVFRYTDLGNHYLLECSNDGTQIMLYKKVGSGSYQELARESQGTVAGTWYHYEVVLKGSSIKIYVDDTLIIDETDSDLTAGKIGIGAFYSTTWPASTIYFDNVNVSGLKPSEILVPLNGSGMLGFTEGSPFQILDNDMTDGQAWVQVPAGLYDTYDQARGKPGGNLYWGNYHARSTGKPVWEQHNDPLNWGTGQSGNWRFTNNGVTCYSFRLYPLP